MAVATASGYVPPDFPEAYAEWRANCGPAAVAALVGRPLALVRRLFPHFPGKPWCNVTQIRDALTGCGLAVKMLPNTWPDRGLVHVQWEGPWMAEGVPVAARYRHTHWIAVDGECVFDVNGGGEWLSRGRWEAEIVPLIVRHTRNATGGWHPRMGLSV